MPNDLRLRISFAKLLKTKDRIEKLDFHFIFKRLTYTLTVYCYGSKSLTQSDACQSGTYGTKYRVRQIVLKTTRTDINSRSFQAALIV